jgi:hypothetical protein
MASESLYVKPKLDYEVNAGGATAVKNDNDEGS